MLHAQPEQVTNNYYYYHIVIQQTALLQVYAPLCFGIHKSWIEFYSTHIKCTGSVMYLHSKKHSIYKDWLYTLNC